MLSDGKDKGIIQSQLLTLRLDNIDVVSLCVGSRMSCDKFIWRILASVDDGESKGQRMRNVFDTLHQTSFASINLQYALAFITGQ